MAAPTRPSAPSPAASATPVTPRPDGVRAPVGSRPAPGPTEPGASAATPTRAPDAGAPAAPRDVDLKGDTTIERRVTPEPEGAASGPPGASWAGTVPAVPIAGAGTAATAAVVLDRPTRSNEVEPDPAVVPTGRRFRVADEPPRRHVPWWRRIGFALVLLALVAAIPVLGKKGYDLVGRSRDGTLGPDAPGPNDPGYEELVTSTPTALIIQKDGFGLPVALTFLSLSNGDAGGSVIFVPLDTVVPEPGFGVDRLRTAYSAVADDPVGATAQLAQQTGKVLSVGIDETYELDDRGWSQVVAPVAPLTIDNPEPIDLPSGTVASGEVSLTADQVGPYLAATREGEDGAAAFFRQETLLRAWLAAVAAKGDGGVTGELAGFISTLARGEVRFATLPGTYAGGFPEPVRYEPDASALNDLITEAVPAPVAPVPGARITVRLLNGVAPGAIPGEVIRTVVSMQGSVTVLGNGPSFGRDQTSIVYSDPAKEAYAKALLEALGGTGEVRQEASVTDVVDITVVLGRDVLGDDPTGGTTSTAPGSTTPASSTVPGTAGFGGVGSDGTDPATGETSTSEEGGL